MPGTTASLKDRIDRGEPLYVQVAMSSLALGTLLEAFLGESTLSSTLTVYLDQSEAIPGKVLRVRSTAGGLVGHKDIVASGVAPAAGQCSLAWDATLKQTIVTFAAADAVTACRVDYEPTQAAALALDGLIGG
jgi:hypothetical protein